MPNKPYKSNPIISNLYAPYLSINLPAKGANTTAPNEGSVIKNTEFSTMPNPSDILTKPGASKVPTIIVKLEMHRRVKLPNVVNLFIFISSK